MLAVLLCVIASLINTPEPPNHSTRAASSKDVSSIAERLSGDTQAETLTRAVFGPKVRRRVYSPDVQADGTSMGSAASYAQLQDSPRGERHIAFTTPPPSSLETVLEPRPTRAGCRACSGPSRAPPRLFPQV